MLIAFVGLLSSVIRENHFIRRFTIGLRAKQDDKKERTPVLCAPY